MLCLPEMAESSWVAHPRQAAGLRAFITLAPVGAALTTAVLLAPLLPAARSVSERLLWWLVLCLLSTGPLLLTSRLVRRLLPLSSLLHLTMLFPDEAPSRLKVARQAAGVKDLQRRAQEARREGYADEPAKAAETILTLIAALSRHDLRTRGHSERVNLYVQMLAEELGLPEQDQAKLRWAALVHDIGKIEIPVALLNKPGPPTSSEWEELKRHPIEGARFCVPLRRWLGEWGLAIQQHHERWDGTGYPHGLAGHEISRAARIVAVADAYETMTAARPYKKPLSAAAAREELAEGAGTQFDPAIVRAFLNISLRELRWATGAASWIAQWPLVAHLPRLGEVAAASSLATASATTLALGGFVEPGQPSFAGWRDSLPVTAQPAPAPVEPVGPVGPVGPPAPAAASAPRFVPPPPEGADSEQADEPLAETPEITGTPEDSGQSAQRPSSAPGQPGSPAQTDASGGGPGRAEPPAAAPQRSDPPAPPHVSLPTGADPPVQPPAPDPGPVLEEVPGRAPETPPGLDRRESVVPSK